MKTTLIVCLAFVLMTLPAFGQAPEVELDEPEAEIEGEELEETEEDHDDDDIEVLGRNIRLDFKLTPLEAGDQGSFIVTAIPEFELEVSYKGQGTKVTFTVGGEVAILDDGKILVSYSGNVFYQGGEGEAEMYSSSGVILEPGKKLKVAKLGEKTLVIEARYLETETEEEGLIE